jgi:hypothetical protein
MPRIDCSARHLCQNSASCDSESPGRAVWPYATTLTRGVLHRPIEPAATIGRSRVPPDCRLRAFDPRGGLENRAVARWKFVAAVAFTVTSSAAFVLLIHLNRVHNAKPHRGRFAPRLRSPRAEVMVRRSRRPRPILKGKTT